ncbi:VanW family protein [bacterium]|nr:VanW family protein [bacterium]
MDIIREKRFTGKWLLVMIAIFLLLLFLLSAAYFIFEKQYENRIYPGIIIGGINMSGLTKEEAKNKLNTKINNLHENGIEFHYHDFSANLMPLVSSFENDLAYEIITFDIEKTLEQALDYGRFTKFYLYKKIKYQKVQNFYPNLQNKLKALFYNVNFPVNFTINDEELISFLKNNFFRFETPAENAKIIYKKKRYPLTYTFTVEDEIFGQKLNYQEARQTLKKNMAEINTTRIDLSAVMDYPTILKKDALNIDAKAKDIIGQAPLKLSAKKETWKIDKKMLADWLLLKPNNQKDNNDKIIVGFDSATVTAFLLEYVVPKINKEPIEAKFEIKNGKVAEFQASQDGHELDLKESIKTIEKKFIFMEEKEVNLIVKEMRSDIRTEEINNVGIKEIIGIGYSNFAGSPKNRRHNIAVGAASVNGSLIAPGEEFSLNKVLGEINADTGYLPELVIKEGKTIPEYGGGLCQIGTTAFRGTTNSGLPVTMRRNHSYRVGYYEPAGTDATIYSPWPDYKFENDTGSHILIQSRIEGNNLYFDFWGTNDDRVATQTYPIIYNIVRPAPTKIIETLDLDPGVKKCTEHAHNGADAYFDYTVTYPDGKIKETRFSSHYVPWRAVCLLGVEVLSKNLPDDKKINATSTEETKQ